MEAQNRGALFYVHRRITVTKNEQDDALHQTKREIR